MYLPSSPTPAEKFLYLDSGRHRLYLISTVSTILLLVGMGLFVTLNPYFIPYTLFAVVSFIYLFTSYGIGLLARDFDFHKHITIRDRWFDRSCRETVDVFLPVCGEDINVLKNTWGYVDILRGHHRFEGGDINVYVLDDGKSDECKALASKFNFHYIRRESNALKKAGNLRNAFKQTRGDFIVILDADFCPRADFLLETLPYMYEDTNLAIVQTPQFFETREKSFNVVERGSAQIQELFYRLIQTSRDYFKGAICVGTSALYRRKHLEPFGGTAPIQWSEDVHTAVMLMKAGHGIKYIPLNLSKGLCPSEWKQFFTQFYRWSVGSLSLLLDKTFWSSSLSVSQKLCFATGFGFYVTTGLYSILVFTPSLYLLLVKPDFLKWYNVAWSIPSLFLTNIYLRAWQRTGYSTTAITCRAVSCYAHLFALFDIVMGRVEAWVPTGTNGRSNRFEVFKRFVIAHNVLLSVVLFGLIFWRRDVVGWVNVIPVTLLFTYHIYTLWPILRYSATQLLPTQERQRPSP